MNFQRKQFSFRVLKYCLRVKLFLLTTSFLFFTLPVYFLYLLNTSQPEYDITDNFVYPLNRSIVECTIAFANNHELPSECTIINKYYVSILLNNVTKCVSDQKEHPVELVVVVKSTVANIENRQAIRKTWGQEDFYGANTMRIIFVVGKSTDDAVMARVSEESIKYGDILMIDVIDNYHNVTFKTIISYQWILNYCSQSKYYLFSDDDMFHIIKNYLKFVRSDAMYPCNLTSFTPLNILYAGIIMNRSRAYTKETYSKWYVPAEDYYYNYYPPYPTGGAYVLSKNAVKYFYYGTFFTKHLWIDDAYVGIIAKKLGIEPKMCDAIRFEKFKYPEQYENALSIGDSLTPQDFDKIWIDLRKLQIA